MNECSMKWNCDEWQKELQTTITILYHGQWLKLSICRDVLARGQYFPMWDVTFVVRKMKLQTMKPLIQWLLFHLVFSYIQLKGGRFRIPFALNKNEHLGLKYNCIDVEWAFCADHAQLKIRHSSFSLRRNARIYVFLFHFRCTKGIRTHKDKRKFIINGMIYPVAGCVYRIGVVAVVSISLKYALSSTSCKPSPFHSRVDIIFVEPVVIISQIPCFSCKFHLIIRSTQWTKLHSNWFGRFFRITKLLVKLNRDSFFSPSR